MAEECITMSSRGRGRRSPVRGSWNLAGGQKAWALGVVAGLLLAGPLRAQTPVTGPANLDTTLAAGEADAQKPVKRGLAKYNEFDLGFTTFRLGYGFLVDFATYVQDDAAKQQVVPDENVGL